MDTIDSLPPLAIFRTTSSSPPLSLPSLPASLSSLDVGEPPRPLSSPVLARFCPPALPGDAMAASCSSASMGSLPLAVEEVEEEGWGVVAVVEGRLLCFLLERERCGRCEWEEWEEEEEEEECEERRAFFARSALRRSFLALLAEEWEARWEEGSLTRLSTRREGPEGDRAKEEDDIDEDGEEERGQKGNGGGGRGEVREMKG